MKPIRLVIIPSSDDAFAREARATSTRIPAALDDDAARAWLEAELRRAYPTAAVRAQVDLAKAHPDDPGAWYVFRREYRSRISKSVVVPVAPAEAFAIYTERVVEWQSAVELRPLRVTGALIGDEYDACYRLLGQEFHGRFRIVDADPPRSLTTEAGGSGIRVWYVTRFEADPGGTRVRVLGDYELPEGVVPRVADRLFIERAIDRDIERAHATFAALSEAWAGTAASVPPAGPAVPAGDASSPTGRAGTPG